METRTAISNDGSRKYTLRLGVGLQMEASFFKIMNRERPNIACVSTQLGCAVACPFCAAAHAPFFRNLTKEEMLLEISSILHDQPADQILREGFEVSFMGTGEPLANLSNVLGVVEQIHIRYPRVTRVSVSTAGPAARIYALAHAMPVLPAVHLQISLHATKDEIRQKLVPKAPDSIANLLQAGHRYHEKTGDQVYLNYVLLKGLNDSEQDARWLAQLDREAFYVKIAALNQTAAMPSDIVGASMDEIRAFSRRLDDYQVPHKIFVGDGLDVEASCGQLAATPREVHA
ncbi:MAG: radical SAM protein [Candidatus Sulfotelmatobacter sp.]|jgi:23S rRNA (adenine2503-C2)-methyltransferase